MAKKIIVTTAYGTAAYPYITKPDTFGRFADNKYKTKLILDDVAFEKFKAEFTNAVGSIPKGYKLPWTTNDEGQHVLTAKSKFLPKVNLPADEDELDENEYIASGSKIKMACEVYDYDKGFSLQLLEVRVKDLVRGSGSGGSLLKDDDDEDERPVKSVKKGAREAALSI
jgi:predicted transcriptional regulator